MNLTVPKHIAITMDGNGRWAKQRGLRRTEGHRQGAELVFELADYCAEQGVKYMTLFTFSTENWQRPMEEVQFLMNYLPTLIYNKYQMKFQESNYRLRLLGRLAQVPKKTRALLEDICQTSQEHTGMQIILAMNYGGKAEIIDTCKRLMLKVKQGELNIDTFNENDFQQQMYLPDVPPVDYLIRTGGDQRISNFMLWQAAYAELYFTPVYWPDFHIAEMQKALQSFANRKRRFGKV